jgi:hypothetical protein
VALGAVSSALAATCVALGTSLLPSSSPMAAGASREGPVRLRPALRLLPRRLVRNPPAEITDRGIVWFQNKLYK